MEVLMKNDTRLAKELCENYLARNLQISKRLHVLTCKNGTEWNTSDLLSYGVEHGSGIIGETNIKFITKSFPTEESDIVIDWDRKTISFFSSAHSDIVVGNQDYGKTLLIRRERGSRNLAIGYMKSVGKSVILDEQLFRENLREWVRWYWMNRKDHCIISIADNSAQLDTMNRAESNRMADIFVNAVMESDSVTHLYDYGNLEIDLQGVKTFVMANWTSIFTKAA